MEKLIELLNEYEIEREEKIDLFKDEEKPLWEWYKDCTGDLTFEPTNSKIRNWEAFSWDTGHSVIISKSYGFIKWLVEKDKIDIKALVVKGEMRSWWDFENKKWNEESGEEIWNKYYSELCLMILAIQDEPIEFLISILK